jgi:hypothetical protein
MKDRMKKLPTYEEFIAEAYSHVRPGNIIEYIVPGTHINHTGKVIERKPTFLVVLDDKTGKKLKVPLNGIGAAYESEEEE